MKDAKGHGSDARGEVGAHAEQIDQLPTWKTPEDRLAEKLSPPDVVE